MKDLIRKLEGHTKHLLDEFLNLKCKYALIAPMLFNDNLTKRYLGKRRMAFDLVRFALHNECILHLIKVTADNDKRTPSVTNIMGCLDAPGLIDELKKKYCSDFDWSFEQSASEINDADMKRYLEKKKNEEREKRGNIFDKKLLEMRNLWGQLESKNEIKSLKILRDKRIAHIDLSKIGEEYVPLDVSKLGLKWNVVREIIEHIEPIVSGLNSIVRRESFNMSDATREFDAMRDEFWELK